jgi:hypothetical protein
MTGIPALDPDLAVARAGRHVAPILRLHRDGEVR